MRMRRRGAAGAIFDEDALDALARNIRQFMLIDKGNLGRFLACVMGLRGAGRNRRVLAPWPRGPERKFRAFRLRFSEGAGRSVEAFGGEIWGRLR